MDSSDSQYRNADISIALTESGISMSIRLVALSKALAPIDVTPSSIVTCLISSL